MKYITEFFVDVMLLIVAYCCFVYKHTIDFEEVCTIPVKSEFYPMAYVVFHDNKNLNSFFEITDETKSFRRHLCKSLIFDFDEFSYCIFYGKKVSQMFYSYKLAFFDDPSPSYDQGHGRVTIFVTYQNQPEPKKGYVYIYKIKKNTKLRGFLGP